MLHLVATLIKLSWLLAILKLATTIFHLEFGISRHYLRLLEIIFRIGQEKFRIVGCQTEDDDHDHDHEELAGATLTQTQSQPQTLATTTANGCSHTEVRRPSSLGELVKARKRVPLQQSPNKTRRISTPDGPPVFLLDDDYDDDDDDDDDDPVHVQLYDGSERKGAGDRLEHDTQTDLGASKVGRLRDCAYHQSDSQQPWRSRKHEFQLYDPCRLVVRGISAIIDDDVIKRFTPEQLKSWNLLTRTNAKNYQFMSRSIGLFWLLGLLVRYLILLPLRIMFTLTGLLWLISTMMLIGALPKRLRLQPYRLMSLMSFRMLACGITSRLEFHNRQHRARLGDICVANHTSPLDVVLLACDNCYALVGQRHGGILGFLEKALSRATEHVWFDRSEMRDRQLVGRRLREHINVKSNLPVLIFPEGTCINNSAVMMFRKGSFETTDRVCPVAIKYDPRFGDPFWNSSKQSYVQYLLMMMSSWAIKCDVWYLPPMDRLEDESSAEFANRVKAEIAKQGGLDDLAWDGQLKRTAPKTVWKFQQQEDFAKRLKLE